MDYYIYSGEITREHVLPVKPISEFLARWNAFLARAEAGEVSEIGFVGGGAGGVELCLAVHHYLATHNLKQVRVHLFTDGPNVLPEFDEVVRQKFAAVLSDRQIEVHTDFRVASVSASELHAANGQVASLDEIFWVTSAAPHEFLAATDLAVNERGFLATRDTLQVANYPNVFAAGDTAVVDVHPRPRAGVFAVRQGAPLFRNLTRFALGQEPLPFKPQTRFLSLVSTGDKAAVGSRNGMNVSGRWVWWWKDWIDRRFMTRFSDLPVMKPAKPSGLLAEFDEQMHCGGCGSKVASDILTDVLDDLGVVGERDDATILTPPAGHVMLQSVDGFRTFVDDPYVFARIALNHAMSDIHAMGAKPVTALASVTLPFARPEISRSLLKQLLAGAIDQLEQEGASLGGGHTSEGAELSLSFAVTGYGESAKLLTKGGMQTGDKVILTKALGTGTLFAADMQHKARGRWVTAAIDSMLMPQGRAVSVLRDAGVHALTDVTGFGLAGHGAEMVAASDRGICFDLRALPALPGALETLNDLGISSTLHAANAAPFSMLDSGHAARGLLFDPQTAGGLLAAVPAENADACVAALRQAGYSDAALIGEVTEAAAVTVRA